MATSSEGHPTEIMSAVEKQRSLELAGVHHRLRQDFAAAQAETQRRQSILEAAQARRYRGGADDTPERQALSARQQAEHDERSMGKREYLDHVIEQSMDQLQQAQEHEWRAQAAVHEAEMNQALDALQEADIFPVNETFIEQAVDEIESDTIKDPSDPAVVEVMRRRELGQSLAEVRERASKEAQERRRLDTELRTAEAILDPKEAMKQTAIFSFKDFERMKGRLDKGEDIAQIVEQLRTRKAEFDDIDRQRNRFAQPYAALLRTQELLAHNQGRRKASSEAASQQHLATQRDELRKL